MKIQQSSYMNNTVNKPWGREELIVHTKKYVMKKLFIKQRTQLSKLFHMKKNKTIYITKGHVILNLSQEPGESNILKLTEGESWTLIPKTIYRLETSVDQSVELFEVSTPELDDAVFVN